MECPECKTPLITLELKEVEIDYCSSCAGVWLDSGELEMLTGTSGKKSNLLEKIIEAERIGEEKYKCPICSRKMVKIAFDVDMKLVLDKCGKGDGYWLNKGELESVLSLRGGGSADDVVSLLKDMFNYENKDQSESG